MSQTVTTVLECPFKLKGIYAITVNGVSKDVNSSSSAQVYWYRPVLAASSGAGASTNDPKSFFAHFASLLGAGFVFSYPTSTGKFTLGWSGMGTATVVWGSGKGRIIRDLLGFTGDLSIPTGTTVTSTYVPAYRLCIVERRNDTYWTMMGTGNAYAESDNGEVAGANGRRVKMRRLFTLGMHPTHPSSSTAAIPSTPVLSNLDGADSGRLLDPGENLETTSPPAPFTVHAFWCAARGRRLAAALGTFPQLVSGSIAIFDEVFLDAKTCNEGPRISLREARWSELMDVGPWGFTLRQEKVSL